MTNDVLLNKSESIERCIKQARKYYQLPSDTSFEKDFLKQDAIALNIQRACEQALDLANHLIRVNKFGIPKESKQSFLILAKNKVISKTLAERLGKMENFRNIAVHEYQSLNLKLMIEVIEIHLDDLLTFTTRILKSTKK